MKLKLIINTGRFFKKITISLICLFSISNVHAGPFDDGVVTGTLAISNASILAENYTVLGLGAGYFVIDGLQLGLDVGIWTGGNRSVYEVTPRLTYVYKNRSAVKPYAGFFYNRTFIEGFDDSNSLGYRLGFYSPIGENAYFGIGGVYSELQNCTKTESYSCSSSYTEFSVVFAF